VPSLSPRLLVEASHLVKDIPEIQQSSAAANIAGQLVRAADLPDALATARQLPKTEDQAQVIGSIAWQLAHDGNVAQALALVESTADGQNKGVAFELVAELVAERGNLQGALEIAHRIQNEPGRLIDTLVRLAKTGDRSEAREAIEDAVNTAEAAVKQNIGNATALTQIATTQAEIGDTADAFMTLDRFSGIARQYQGVEGNGVFLQQLASAQAQIGDLNGAQRTIEEILTGNSDLALMVISQEQGKQGLMVDALANAERISSPALKSSAFREIAMIRGTRGTLDDALEAIDHISELAGRAEALAILALEQADNENPSASLTLQTAWKLATQNGSGTSDDVFGSIAVTRALLSDFAGAQEVVQEMSELESRAWSLRNITSHMVKAGHTKEALALAENQEAAYPKAYALLGSAQGILNHHEAEQQACAKGH
jgi:tetratricopeptide (TPR) repeat protein